MHFRWSHRWLLLLACFVTVIGAKARHVQIYDEDSEPYKPMPLYTVDAKEKEENYWRSQAKEELEKKLLKKTNTNVAKNVIFFLGDGMSLTTIAAARIYEGQLKNKTGEEHKLYFETFPVTGLAKTYCTDKQVADSACTATAYMTGVKGNYQTIGVTANVDLGDCEASEQPKNQASSIIKWAQEAGKATGIVTTTRLTHASPAGGYAHIPYRNLESDKDVRHYKVHCNTDIAKQLMYQEPGKNIKVLMGGGLVKFLPNDTSDTEMRKGERLDGENLIQVWYNDKVTKKNKSATKVFNRNQLLNIDVNSTEYVLGLFAPSHLNYTLESNRDEQPTLAEMTKTAIEILRKEEKGFYLFVEGGKIDLAHHANRAHIALDETIEFAKAIQVAAELTSEDDTLIVVTSDHSHVMSFSGYPARGTDVLKYYGKSKDNLTYPTLSYANGPGYRPEQSAGIRHDFTKDNFDDLKFRYPALVPKSYESHGGDDVAVYARGPWSHLFSGTYEQNYIPMVEAYAAKIGPFSNINHAAQSAAEHPTFHFLVIILFYVLRTTL